MRHNVKWLKMPKVSKYLKLLFFEKNIGYSNKSAKFNWRNLPTSTSMSMSLSVSVTINTDMDRDMDVDILSAIVGGELQQHKSQGLPGWCHLLL